MRRIAGVAVLATIFGAPACLDLPASEPSRCGDAIVQPERGEDCDGFPIGGTPCGAPGTPAECRLVCTSGAACPTGYGCGVDGICRTRDTTKDYEPLTARISSPAISIDVGDFDGDGRKDVITSGYTIDVAYFDATGTIGSVVDLATVPTIPAIGKLTSATAETDDIALSLTVGMGVLRGEANRSLLPTSYSSLTLPTGVQLARFIAVSRAAGFDDAITLATSNGENRMSHRAMDGSDIPFGKKLPAPVTSLAVPPMVGDVIEGDSCEEVVLAYQNVPNVDALFVYATCTGIAKAWPSDDQALIASVALQAKHHLAGRAFLVDADGDGHLDLVATTTCPAAKGRCIDVAYGDGSGHFSDRDPMAVQPDDRFTTYLTDPFLFPCKTSLMQGMDPTGRSAAPLAVGDLNGDGILDLVTATGIYLSDAKGGTRATLCGPEAMMQEPGHEYYPAAGQDRIYDDALIADFNGNGLPDVIASNADAPGLEFLNGAPGAKFNTFHITTSGHVSNLLVGDYDGDLLPDLAFAESNSPDGDPGLSVVFGQSAGAPVGPFRYGYIGNITQITKGSVLHTNDAIDDLIVLSSKDEKTDPITAAVVAGSSSRLLEAPYIFSTDDAPIRFAIGNFLGDDSADVVALTETVTAHALKLWTAPGQGNAALASPLDPVVLEATNYYADGADYLFHFAMVGADLDPPASGTGLDELIFSYPVPDKTPHGAIFTASFANAPKVDITKVLDLDDSTYVTRLRAFVLDPKKRKAPDIAALVVDNKGVPHDKPEAAKHSIRILWNEEGKLSPMVLDGPDSPLNDFAFLNADEDGLLDIIAVSKSAAYLGKLGADRKSFGGWQLLEGFNGAQLVTAGDFTGDGVDDIAVVANGEVLFYRGVPTKP